MSTRRFLSCALGVALLAIVQGPGAALAQGSSGAEKINAYVACLNGLSGRAHESKARYLSWVGKSGPTGKEKIVYGTYTIYNTAGCKKGVEAVATAEPRDADLEAAASAYVAATVALEPLLKEADDYYTQGNYKDDKMAKGKAMHAPLMAAWATFEAADSKLSASIEVIQDRAAVARLAEIESKEGRKGRYHIEALMLRAKAVLKAQTAGATDIAAITSALAAYEASVKDAENFAAGDPNSKIGSNFVSLAKSFLTTSKGLMRRVRDKVPYNTGEQMILRSPGGSWMVEGSPARLTRDYNQLIESYNRGASF
jgi:Protein of unknown function (DUF3829)